MVDFDQTLEFSSEKDEQDIHDTLMAVFNALEDKNYNSINQLVGYFFSGDPSYITGHQNAREKIQKFDREDLFEEVLKFYFDNNCKSGANS